VRHLQGPRARFRGRWVKQRQVEWSDG
jgi:hypothetical protein